MKQITLKTLIVLFSGALALGLLAFEFDWLTKFLVMGVLLGVLCYFALRFENQKHQMEELQRLRATYEQMDHQAKLIIRTDLELHRTQEELDHKLSALVALHELGQQLRVTLNPSEIYGTLTAQFLNGFGFSRGLVALCPAPEQLNWAARIGISDEEAEPIRQHLLTSGWLRDLLTNPAPRTLRASSASGPAVQRLLELLDTKTLTAAGVVPQAGPSGVLLLVREGGGVREWRGDDELIAILTTQLAIAVENSALYGEAWQAQRALEQKVQERTQELASANTQLMRLNKSKSDFVSAVSHELRTPMAAIKGYASLLRSGQFGPMAEPQAERLAKIEKHTDLLTQLINNLLDIARIESGRVTMEARAIETDEFLTMVLDVVKPQMDAKRIRFAANADGVTRLVGDPAHLPRIFINLLSNATKYTPEGGTITMTLQQTGQAIVATVQDSGCGIAPEDVPKLFQEFYRTSNPVNEKVRGTGLGLALVKRIVEAHHGQIAVSSKVGKGTTVTVTLPAELSELPPASDG